MRFLKNNNKELGKKKKNWKKRIIVCFAFKNSFVIPMSYILDRREENQFYTLSEKKIH